MIQVRRKMSDRYQPKQESKETKLCLEPEGELNKHYAILIAFKRQSDN